MNDAELFHRAFLELLFRMFVEAV